MDKNAIKSFAVESRRQMIESVKYQASLIGITAEGISEPISKAEGMETYDYGAGTYSIYDNDIQKRENLIKEISNKGFDNVVEEVAYTWFNRIIAIRFMEVNDYLPTRTRVLSTEVKGKTEPDIITEASNLDLDYSSEDIKLIIKLNEENELDSLFQFLFIKQCNKLNEILPGLFEKTDDYMELLLNISFTSDNGIVRQLIDVIPEEEYGEQVEIIGWLYQYYNSELKDETFANIKKCKVSKHRIPAVTQLFTPDWIVKYLVENSLGRLWLEAHHNDELMSNWEYYLEEAEQESGVNLQLENIRKIYKNIKLEDIKIIDPCMGSGHILVYIFDVLMQIYLSEGYTKQDAVISILKNNIYGLDIDDRAYQLAYFSVMMKAREYNRKIFEYNVIPLLSSIQESNNISNNLISLICSNFPEIKSDLNYIIELFKDSKLFGSIINIRDCQLKYLNDIVDKLFYSNNNDLSFINYKLELTFLKRIIFQASLLNQKYDVVVTNPPYMGSKNMSADLKEYLEKNYPLTKRDLYAVFLERGVNLVKDYGFSSMVTMQGWMFIPAFEKFRKEIFNKVSITTLLHMDNMVMGIAFGTSASVFRKFSNSKYKSTFNQVKFKDIKNDKPISFPISKNKNNVSSLEVFNKIPGFTISYWVKDNLISVFENAKVISDYGSIVPGISCGNTKKFLRFWYEVQINKIVFDNNFDNVNLKSHYWVPYTKGGFYKKWFGNQEYVINWKNGPDDKLRGRKNYSNFYLKKFISWSLISNNISLRYFPEGFLCDIIGPAIFGEDKYLYYILGFLNSNICMQFLMLIAPTMSFTMDSIKKVPILFDEYYCSDIFKLVESNINIVEEEYNSFETSLNFKFHYLISGSSIKDSFERYSDYKLNQYNLLTTNENELDQIFSKIYNISIDEEVVNKPSISLANYETDIKSFISYAVGCMFGRYSLDNEGLQFAGGIFDLSDYSKFIPDDDNIIPVLDTEYFDDDIVGRFVEFVKICFGEEMLEGNLDFIAGALNKKGKTSREIIRNYFLTEFFKNHIQTFNKTPIYWQFDSGKQNAFKCLIYMHRYEPDIVARVRTDYLHKTQKAIEQNMTHCEKIITNSSNKSEVSKATKDKSKYIKQLEEIKVYDEALRHIATQNIEIDLDDGVKVNYAKFQKVEVSIEGERTKKINLLKKI